MATARKWSNVAVAMQSALGTAGDITAISKAAEGVVSAVNTLVNGEFVLLSVVGMSQVNKRIFRVKSASGSGFTLEGENTTDFDTFTSGTFQKVTFGTSITTATVLNGSGGEFETIPTTTIHANQRTSISGLPSEIKYDFDHIWDVSDAGLKALKAASDLGADRAMMFTFGTGGPIMVFTGTVGCTLIPVGQSQSLVTTKSVITMSGSPTYYAS